MWTKYKVHGAHIKWPTCDGWWLIGKISRRDTSLIPYDIDKTNPIISLDVTKWSVVTLSTNIHTGVIMSSAHFATSKLDNLHWYGPSVDQNIYNP